SRFRWESSLHPEKRAQPARLSSPSAHRAQRLWAKFRVAQSNARRFISKMRLRALVLVGFVSTTVACDHWPGVSKDGPSNPDPTPSAGPVGTCSGTPLPCEGLSGIDCYADPGCLDH